MLVTPCDETEGAFVPKHALLWWGTAAIFGSSSLLSCIYVAPPFYATLSAAESLEEPHRLFGRCDASMTFVFLFGTRYNLKLEYLRVG